MCAVRKEYGRAHFQWQKEKSCLQNECQTLAARINSLEQENKCMQEKIAALTGKSEPTSVELKQFKTENKIMANRAKQFQSGMKRNIQHNCLQTAKGEATERGKKNAEDIYEVENVLDHKIAKKQRKFLVHWKGYNSKHDTWEPEKSLNCPKLLKLYLKSKNIE